MELITEKEASEILRVSRNTLYIWRKQGKIPFHKIGKPIRYDKADIIKKVAQTIKKSFQKSLEVNGK